MKTVHKVAGMWDGVINSSNLDEAKPIFTVETEQTLYKGNTLNDAMRLWATSGDDSEVIDVIRLG